MPRRRRHTDSEPETSIDISPLIDCVFILLIFFIVTTTFIDEWGLGVDKPSAAQAEPPDDEDKPEVIIELRGSNQVLFNGNRAQIGALRQLIRNEIGNFDDIPAIIKTERDVPAALTVRAVDQANQGGASRVMVMSLN